MVHAGDLMPEGTTLVIPGLGYAALRSACIKKVPTSQRAVKQVCAEFDVVRLFNAVK